MQKCKNAGFTLIEILVVVVVILLLTGMLFRIGNVVVERSNRGRALADMEKISNALEEYFSVFGNYPPVSGTVYGFPAGFSDDVKVQEVPVLQGLYNDGLMAYLRGRVRGDPKPCLVGDVKHRWSHYLDGLNFVRGAIPDSEDTFIYDGAPFLYHREIMVYRTPWGENYVYSSSPPYLSYRLRTHLPSGESVSLSSAGQ